MRRDSRHPDTIDELSESLSNSPGSGEQTPRSSALTQMLKASPPNGMDNKNQDLPYHTPSIPEVAAASRTPSRRSSSSSNSPGDHERSSLLRKDAPHDAERRKYGSVDDLEDQTTRRLSKWRKMQGSYKAVTEQSHHVLQVATHPKTWDRKIIWREGFVKPVQVLPAVFLGLLLNILDALSYGGSSTTVLTPKLIQMIRNDIVSPRSACIRQSWR